MKPGSGSRLRRKRSACAHDYSRMHYGTFPALTGTPAELELEMKRLGVLSKVEVLTPGQEVTLKELASIKVKMAFRRVKLHLLNVFARQTERNPVLQAFCIQMIIENQTPPDFLPVRASPCGRNRAVWLLRQ